MMIMNTTIRFGFINIQDAPGLLGQILRGDKGITMIQIYIVTYGRKHVGKVIWQVH